MLDFRNAVPEEQEGMEEKQQDMGSVNIAAAIDPEKVGIYSDAIALVATLCDPSRPDKTMRKDPKTGEMKEHVIGTICGYQFKVLKDLDIPEVGTTIFYKSDVMDYIEENKDNTVHVKKGDVVNLTHFETAKLLSTPEFNGNVDGKAAGSMRAVIAYQNPGSTPKQRADGRFALPLAYMRATEKGISIRDLKQVPVIDVAQKEVNGQIKRVKSAKEGFEKWAPLAQSRAVTPNMVKAQSGVKDNVLNFMNLLNA